MKRRCLCLGVALLLLFCMACTPEEPSGQNAESTAQATAGDTAGNNLFDMPQVGTGNGGDADFPNEPESDYTKRY